MIHAVDVFCVDALLDGYENARKGKTCKDNVVDYHMELLYKLDKLSEKLINGTYKMKKLIRFTIHEPKEREIVADSFEDKIVQDVLTRQVLTPLLKNRMIYDNSAAQENKGVHQALKRLERYSRIMAKDTNWTGEAWALVCDIKKFFYRIDHEILKNLIDTLPVDNIIKRTFYLSIDACTPDINQYSNGDDCGICIGFQTSQWFAIWYLTALDNYIKNDLRIKCYGRYMDDFYLIHEDKKYLEECRQKINIFLRDKLKLELNEKTHIHPFSQGICFLGYHVTYNPRDRRVHTKIRKKSIKKMKRRVNKQIKQIRRGKLTVEKALASLESWRGYASHSEKNNYKKAYDKAKSRILREQKVADEYHDLMKNPDNTDSDGFYKLHVLSGEKRNSSGTPLYFSEKTTLKEEGEEKPSKRKTKRWNALESIEKTASSLSSNRI